MNAYRDQLRAKIAEVAADMLDGTTGSIAGARRITDLRDGADLRGDADMEPFALIDSETETLPVDASARALWNSDALERIKPDIDKAEAWARGVAQEHCKNLLVRFAVDRLRQGTD